MSVNYEQENAAQVRTEEEFRMQTEVNTKNALQIDPEFRSLLPTLTAEERAALEQSIEREGCRDALIVWGDMLVDGHNRHQICTRRGFAFQVRQMDFDSREDVLIWICANQNARCNITPEQKTYLRSAEACPSGALPLCSGGYLSRSWAPTWMPCFARTSP